MLRLSYIIPCFNCAAFIINTLDSLASNIDLEEDEYEIICVDDCSSDNTYETLVGYSVTHHQVRIIRHRENLRQGGGRNTGVQKANGKYIAFADHDDSFPNLHLKTLLDEMDEKGLDIMMCDVNFGQADGSIVQMPGLMREIASPANGIEVFDNGYMIEGGMLGLWSAIYRKDFVMELPPIAEGVRVEDADWMLRAIARSERLMYRPIVIYNWMYNKESQSHVISAEMRADIIRRGFREIEVADELRITSELAYRYCYDDGIQSIKYATNALWKHYTSAYRRCFLRQLSPIERERVVSLNVNKRCDFLFSHPFFCLMIMSVSSFFCAIIGKN